MAFVAVCPSAVFSVDAVAVALNVRATFDEPAAGTLTVTVSAGLANEASRTTSENVTEAPAAGAVKVGDTAVELDSVTPGPAVCVQAYVNGLPSGSLLPDPVKVTVDPVDTD